MNQFELESQVAQQTGESIQTIRDLGFGPLEKQLPVEERPTPLVVDWDEVERIRFTGRAF